MVDRGRRLRDRSSSIWHGAKASGEAWHPLLSPPVVALTQGFLTRKGWFEGTELGNPYIRTETDLAASEAVDCENPVGREQPSGETGMMGLSESRAEKS